MNFSFHVRLRSRLLTQTEAFFSFKNHSGGIIGHFKYPYDFCHRSHLVKLINCRVFVFFVNLRTNAYQTIISCA